MSNKRVRITNISNGHIGFSRPTSLFLRRPQESGKANLASAVIFENQVDDAMRTMATKKLITIEFVKDGDTVESVAEKIRVSAAERPKDKTVKLEVKDNSKDMKIEEGTVSITVKGVLDGDEAVVDINDVVKEATDSVEIKVEEPKTKTKIIDPSPVAQVATVGSDKGGEPVIKQGDPPPETEEEAPAATVTASEEEMSSVGSRDDTVFSPAELDSMKMGKVRGVVVDMGLTVKSTKKEDLVAAILKKQGNVPQE